ncbi:Protein of unknown function [Bacillus cytotoxicus]|uniref:Uncharacterized protein n=1 Tax=Bacillus cytotoxicus TaxID=580165 RepID=A0AAX2CDX5_9BACI|nr:Protein of unknown function [Bacillus cytotoxicus]
MTTIRMNAMAA